MPKVLQLHLSWAPTDEEALANAMAEWPNGGMKFPKADIRSPHDFEQMAKLVRAGGLRGPDGDLAPTPTSTGPTSSASSTSASTGSTCTTSGRNQAEWIEVFGREVLPKLHR